MKRYEISCDGRNKKPNKKSIVRDHVRRNKLPCEFLYDAKPPIQMSQGHPNEQKKHVGSLKNVCVGGGGGG